ncbi:RNA polymerase sigma factor [Bacillus sp. V59.32b]|uniref:RNA polymerase sigma factor n=1 Tax=Bacillus sp. V59.32b TaxID=1758642 RepID=UPI000E3B5A5F|nr:RNA polymerase sigma factor [Bacillus sp. V59.32b]RFU67170.1 RNA polymerase sigma factor [Bacillus sp. V59.32b]
MTEEELISRAQNGDMQAFSELISCYSPTVERFAYQMGNKADDIEDITQEVFIRVYRFIHQFSRSKFSTWLYKITLNVTRDYSRKKQSHIRKLFSLQNERQVHSLDSEQHMLRSEEDRVLHECIQKLDEKYRVPIILFYFHDRKYEEISDILTINVSTVKTRLLRGKNLLKKQMELSAEKEGESIG